MVAVVRDKPGGYDEEFMGYQVTLDSLHDNEMKLFDAMEYLNRGADFKFVVGKVAKMRLMLARRNESNEDIEMVCAGYTEYLQKYPPDVVHQVVEQIVLTRKYFPLVSELVPMLDELVSLRRNVLKEFERSRNPVMRLA
jgi:hypothetical protein